MAIRHFNPDMINTPIINLGILAHVDAGKTTLTEQLLWRCGAIREPGRVDSGTTQTDSLDIERRRGISVRAATVAFEWRDVRINLIDTPGHVDFISEVERSLRVLDAAILIVSAVEGIQPHTRVLWEALSALKMPTFVFVNKLDRVGADASRTLAECREIGIPVCPLELASGPNGGVKIQNIGEVVEAVCERDEALLERYFEGDASLEAEICNRVLRMQTASADIVPALCGAALQGEGVEALLEAIHWLCPRADGDPNGEVAGIIYRITQDGAQGRVAHVRLYNGTLRNRDAVRNTSRDSIAKIFQIRKTREGKSIDTGILAAGDIGAVYGLGDARVGDILGAAELVPKAHRIAVPMLRARVFPPDAEHLPALLAALDQLSAEDPLLESTWEQDELHISITGTIQLEVLDALLRERFSLPVTFGPPSVIYRETPAQICEGFEAYTMPKPCWAVIRFLIEPLPRGSGIIYEEDLNPHRIHPRYRGQIRQTLPEALSQGPLGWEVTDLRITLIDGEDHQFHTHPLDFALATPLAMMDGLTRGGTLLLEPMLFVQISAPEDLSSRIIGDLLDMRGTLHETLIRDGLFHLTGRVPVATSLDFPMRLAALSSGEATLSTRFDGYAECPLALGATAKRRGVDPRDRSKYILWKRNAIQN